MAHLIDLQVTLSEDCIDFLRRKVESGEYTCVSDVLTESINVLRDDEDERRRFEQEEVLPAHDEAMADPSTAITLDRFRAAPDEMDAEDTDLETWLHTVGGPIYDRMIADPSRGIPAEQVLRELEERSRPQPRQAV